MPWLLLVMLLTACGSTRSVVHGLPGTVVGGLYLALRPAVPQTPQERTV